jgi:hypothetical protein
VQPLSSQVRRPGGHQCYFLFLFSS